ncbi:MAG TPA: bile acid:sodium symporter family protein [Anaeromyxobacteraceae bacterium]|nr:bile acid:sodium symporter family protein [Anaeromyxobacteraceae bacterium]
MITRHLKRIARDWFLLGMLSAVVLATIAPGIGRSGGPLRADVLGDVGIFAVFFLHGIGLSTEKLKEGVSRWRLHLVVQAFTFIVFPLLWLAFRAAAGGLVPPYLMLGFLYLCALPSTISSSVAMTGIARGNVAAAIFNATLSSLLGVFLTPLLVALVAGNSGSLSLRDAMVKIAGMLVVPLVVGQLARPLVGKWFARWKPYTSVFDRAVIVLLVYVSFCDSVRAGLWTEHGVGMIAMTAAGAAVLLAIVLTLTRRTATLLRFAAEDEITAVFCGSKKTLASGVPMAKLLFGAHPGLGVIVLPIMFYHQLQLLVCSVLAERYASRPISGPAAEG